MGRRGGGEGDDGGDKGSEVEVEGEERGEIQVGEGGDDEGGIFLPSLSTLSHILCPFPNKSLSVLNAIPKVLEEAGSGL
jgi:hypothetical protein